jgi:glycosyltransferase involved in cell wall biosynthesis
VAAGAGIPFQRNTLTQVLERVLNMPEPKREELRSQARERVRTRYSWDAVTDAYERLLTRLATGKS